MPTTDPNAPTPGERLDLHNSAVNDEQAGIGRCGQTHLATGRVCLLPAHHRGPCDFQTITGDQPRRR